MDDVDELCRFWAASNCGEDDVCYVTMMAMLMVMLKGMVIVKEMITMEEMIMVKELMKRRWW